MVKYNKIIGKVIEYMDIDVLLFNCLIVVGLLIVLYLYVVHF